ncbi:hypothetical protein [Clostridium sp.]|uniref:hypothetical protein n=1 Tax=Clostridium sp. TaxID=1506 RepID=UPI001A574AEA|nr:hypothetical protein [Clostridium sp.]MBK5241113.1 hypothetical protein [Clostridium sp.]
MDKNINELLLEIEVIVNKHLTDDSRTEALGLIEEISNKNEEGSYVISIYEIENNSLSNSVKKFTELLKKTNEQINSLRSKLVEAYIRETNITREYEAKLAGLNEFDTLAQQLEVKPEYDTNYGHLKKVEEGNIAFKSNIDTLRIIKLYLEGNSALKIMNILNEGIDKDRISKEGVSRQTIVNRLKAVGLWGNIEKWHLTARTVEEIDYITRHGIEISSLNVLSDK